MVLHGRMETGSLRVGERVEVPTAAGFWNRAVTALADADLTKMGKPDEYHPVVFAGREPVEVMLYFGSQPPSRNVVCPGTLAGESTPRHAVQ